MVKDFKEIQKILTNLETNEPNEGLYFKIINQIKVLERRQKIYHFVINFIFLIIALLNFSIGFIILKTEITSSAFNMIVISIRENLTLIFLLKYEFIFALLENLPVYSLLTLSLGVIFFLISIRSLKFKTHRHIRLRSV